MAHTAKTSQSQMVTVAKDLGRPVAGGVVTSASGRNSANGAGSRSADSDRSEGEQFSRNYLRELNVQVMA